MLARCALGEERPRCALARGVAGCAEARERPGRCGPRAGPGPGRGGGPGPPGKRELTPALRQKLIMHILALALMVGDGTLTGTPPLPLPFALRPDAS